MRPSRLFAPLPGEDPLAELARLLFKGDPFGDKARALEAADGMMCDPDPHYAASPKGIADILNGLASRPAVEFVSESTLEERNNPEKRTRLYHFLFD